MGAVPMQFEHFEDEVALGVGDGAAHQRPRRLLASEHRMGDHMAP